ncbi:MAG: spore coat associated protein CotJA [Bacillota bacterium]
MPPLELATAYIPPQTLDRTYSPAEGLTRGTLFPELYRPYPYSLAR